MDWLLAVSCWLLAIGTIGAIRVIGSLISNLQSPFTYLYRKIRPILFFLEYPLDIFHFPRGRQKIPPKFHLIPPKFHLIPPKFHFILPKFYFAPTWRIFFFHVGISKYPRGNQFSPTRFRFDM